MNAKLALALCLTGCSFEGKGGENLPIDGTPIVDELVLDGGTWTYDTDTGFLMQDGGGAIKPSSTISSSTRVIKVDRVLLTASTTLRAVGRLPLRIESTTTITLEAGAMIDVGSYWVTDHFDFGAGILPTTGSAPMCNAGTAGGSCEHGAGGGGGGGFGGPGGLGGDGGTGHECGRGPQAGTFGGMGGAIVTTVVVRGGCAGGVGGDGMGSTGQNGIGGPGGGAIDLVGVMEISILDATIRAGGAGGRGGIDKRSAGGGGGSGGMIRLAAPTMNLDGSTLTANGGGGGGGSDTMPGNAGADALSAETAFGGTADVKGGLGGVGASGLDQMGMPGAAAERGGGGGGGGAGRVVIDGVPSTTNTTFSPLPD